MNSSKNQTKKVMHSILHHFGDWLLETNHMNRLESSIYFDMRTLYLTGVGLTADLPLLERHLKCNSEAEKEALHFLLRDKFKLCKKTKQYKHIGWNAILRRYKDNKTCNVATQDETNATQHATDTQRESNTSTQRSRKKRLREKLLKEFGLNPDKSMSLEDLQDLYNTKIGNVATQDETNATQHATDMQRECNAEKVSITKNQEPVNNQQQQQTRAEKNFSQPENPIDSPTPFDRFAMHSNWQPTDLDMVNGLLRRAGLPNYDTGLILDAALDFVAYWLSRPDVEQTAAQWDSEFVRSAVKYRTIHGHKYDTTTWELKQITQSSTAVAVQSTSSTPNANAPSKTKQSVMTLSAVREAVVSGRMTTILPTQICLAMIDGLFDLLGHNLKYPPAADAWEFTLTAWAKEFANRGLGDGDVERVRKAFEYAKKQATSQYDEHHFPDATKVLSYLPPKDALVGLKYTPTEAEKAQRKAEIAKQRELNKQLFKNVKFKDLNTESKP